MTSTTPSPDRLPRIIVTGEFSAGKTKLINGLVGQQVLPSNVTSTSLPPVWLIYGDDVSFRVDLDGQVHPVTGIGEVDVHDTLVYVTALQSDTLRHMDIIDTPGNSDPNIPPVCWERMVGHADMMIWCTGATQAWRQSEKSTVRDLPETLRAQGMLLITQADRIADERQREKLKRRVTRDASQFLPDIRMASLIDDAHVAELRAEIIAMADAASARPGTMLDPVEAARGGDAQPILDPVSTDNEAVDAPEDDQSILSALGAAIGSQLPDAADEPVAAADAAEPQSADDENRKVGLELLQVVSKLDKKRNVKRKRSPAMTTLVEALGDQVGQAEEMAEEVAEDAVEAAAEDAVAEAPSNVAPLPEPEPEGASSRVLWDMLVADRQDKEACVDDFIACIDELFMPDGIKPADTDVITAMKSAAARVLASELGSDAHAQPATSSTGT